MPKRLIDLPDHLETERLILRPYSVSDTPAYYEVCRNNQNHLQPFEQDNPALDVKTLADAEKLMRDFGNAWAERQVFFLGAWVKATGEFAAQIYMGAVNWSLPEFELGYFADKDHEGQGFVTEAAKAALKLMFEHMKAHRVRLGCNELNMRSWRVAERCGFVREGHLRQTHNHVLRPDGAYSGDYLYGLLRDEYERLYARG